MIGSSNTDMVIKAERLPTHGETILGGDFLMNPGGKGANQAVAAAKLGGDVVFVAKVGDDIFGHKAVQGFEKIGIDTDYIGVDPDKPSGVASIMVDSRGENCIAVASGANDALTPDDVDRAIEAIDASDVLLMQLETPINAIEHAAGIAKRKGKIVILNPAPAQRLSDKLLASLDVITPNETETEFLTGIKVDSLDDAAKAASVLREKGVEIVVITLGSRGAFVLSESFSGIIPVREVAVVDTTAAGDTFNGALAVALANGKAIEDAIKFATKAATLSVTRMGAQSSIPFLEELEK